MSALSAKWQPACLSVSTDSSLVREVCPPCPMISSRTLQFVSPIHEAIVGKQHRFHIWFLKLCVNKMNINHIIRSTITSGSGVRTKWRQPVTLIYIMTKICIKTLHASLTCSKRYTVNWLHHRNWPWWGLQSSVIGSILLMPIYRFPSWHEIDSWDKKNIELIGNLCGEVCQLSDQIGIYSWMVRLVCLICLSEVMLSHVSWSNLSVYDSHSLSACHTILQ